MCWVVCLCAANAGKQGSGIGHARFYSGSHFAVIRVYGEAGNVIETHEHAGARSVYNDDDARWLAQCLHRSFGSSVDVNPRFLGWLLLVIAAGPVSPCGN